MEGRDGDVELGDVELGDELVGVLDVIDPQVSTGRWSCYSRKQWMADGSSESSAKYV